jgi:hypothetical protein
MYLLSGREDKGMKKAFVSFTVIFTIIILAIGVILVHRSAVAQTDPTPDPLVETIVAETLTALAPTIDSIHPTEIPPTNTPKPSRTPTLTKTPTPTLSVEEQVALTITAVYIDSVTLKVWVANDTGQSEHEWHGFIPVRMQAKTRAEADLLVTIEEQLINSGSANYLMCGKVEGKQHVYTATITTAEGVLVDEKQFRGGTPHFPSSISFPSCPDQIGSKPSYRDFVEWLEEYAYLEPPTPIPSPTFTATIIK